MPTNVAVRIRRTEDRRRVARGGRRASDRLSLTPQLCADAAEYAVLIARCFETLTDCLADCDLVGARMASKTMKEAANEIQRLLTVPGA
jgi:hypothetical protein